MRICVVGIGDSGESRLVRDLLEAQGHHKRLTLAGKPSDVFAGFGFYGATADAAILSAHGDEKGIIFGRAAIAGIRARSMRQCGVEHFARTTPLRHCLRQSVTAQRVPVQALACRFPAPRRPACR